MTSTIYQIYCKDKNITEVYVGSTENFHSRCKSHNNCCNNENDEKYNLKVYKFIREHGGMVNWVIEPIIESDDDTRYDAEVHYFKTYNSKLNSIFPRRTRKEYYLDNREDILEKKNKKFQCQCGGRFTKNNKSAHLKSKLHLQYLEQNEQIE
tara:strand:+ start:389 stop:844 length:456 start_codon:yes stop_codon:yes gene_type:complete